MTNTVCSNSGNTIAICRIVRFTIASIGRDSVVLCSSAAALVVIVVVVGGGSRG